MGSHRIYLKDHDVDKICRAVLHGPNRKDQRNQLLVRLLIVTGLRVSELVNLQVENIDFDERTIYVRHGKGRKDRTTFIDPETQRLLLRFLSGRTSGSVFGIQRYTIWRIVKKMARAAGVMNADKISPHKLRHTFSIRWIQRGGDLESLRRLLGHSSLATTQIYLDFDDAYLRQAYDRLHGTEQQRRLVR